jgi:hypothetical protein
VCNKTDLIYIPEKPLMSVYRKYLWQERAIIEELSSLLKKMR